MMILGIPIDLMIKLCLLPLNTIFDSKLMIKLIGLFGDCFWMNFDMFNAGKLGQICRIVDGLAVCEAIMTWWFSFSFLGYFYWYLLIMIIFMSAIFVEGLLLYTVIIILLCGCNINFHDDFWISPWKKDAFFFFLLWSSSSLYTLLGLSYSKEISIAEKACDKGSWKFSYAKVCVFLG